MGRFVSYLAALFLIVSVIVLVLPNHYQPWVSFNQEFLSWCGLLLVAIAILTNCGGRMIAGWTVLAVLIISLIPLVQYLAGIVFYFGDAFMAFSYLIGFAIAIFIGFNWQVQCKNRGLINPIYALLAYLLVAAVLSTGIAIYQWLNLNNLGYLIVDVGPGMTPGGNLSQRNNFGSLLCMGLVASFYFKHRSVVGFPVFLLLVAFLVLGLAICQSRTPWLVALLSIFWVFYQYKNLVNSKQIVFCLLALVGLYLLLTVLLLPSVADALLLVHESYLRTAEIGGRGAIWPPLVSAVFSGDWLGYGWNQTSVAQVAVSHEFSKSTFTEYSHNLFLDILLWNGLIAGLIIIALIIFWVSRQARLCKTDDHFYLLWVIGCLAVHSMLEYPLAYGYFLVPFGLLVGMAESASGEKFFSISRARLLGTPVLVLFAAVLFILFKDYQIAEAKHRKMRFETAGFIGADKTSIPSGNIVFLTQLTGFIEFATMQAKEGMTAEELLFMKKAASRYAYPPSLFRYALALGLNHEYEESRRILAVLQNLNSKEIYGEAVNNWGFMAKKYPQLANVVPPTVDNMQLEKKLLNKPHR